MCLLFWFFFSKSNTVLETILLSSPLLCRILNHLYACVLLCRWILFLWICMLIWKVAIYMYMYFVLGQNSGKKRHVFPYKTSGVYTSVICLITISGLFLLLYLGLHCYIKRLQQNHLSSATSAIWLSSVFFQDLLELTLYLQICFLCLSIYI